MTHQLQTGVLVGIDRFEAVEPTADPTSAASEPGQNVSYPAYHIFNSAVMAATDGTIVGTYDKMHRVMFGEYIPLAKWLPFLYRITPVTGGIEPGYGPASLEQGGVLYAPNICYETVLPHVIRRQMTELTRQGKIPDVLVNLTNDAWFWGSSELEMHLACGIFRAVEMRTPLVVAANGGLSAVIDSRGRVRKVTKRLQTAFLLADLTLPVRRTTAPSYYAAAGDWFAIGCLLFCVTFGLRNAISSRRKTVISPS